MNGKSFVLIAMAGLLMTGCQHVAERLGANGPNNNSGAQSTPDEFAATRAVFDKNCKGCHGDTGAGWPVKSPDGTRLKVPSLREGHALRHPDSHFVKQNTKGGDGMPAFCEKLKADDINGLIRFIRHEFQGGMTQPAEPMNSPMKNMKMKP